MTQPFQSIGYHISTGPSTSHLLKISAELVGNHQKKIRCSIPAWRPGRYKLENFIKNMVRVQAHKKDGSPIPTKQIDRQSWEITCDEIEDFSIDYEYYAQEYGAGSTYWDGDVLLITPVTCLIFIHGSEHIQHTIQIDYPDGWTCATTLEKIPNTPHTFQAESYDALVDSPLLISSRLKEYKLDIPTHSIYLWIHGMTPPDIDLLQRKLRDVCLEQISMMKEMPCSRYYFLLLIPEHQAYHGVEHLDSNVSIFGPGWSLVEDDQKRKLIGILSHEFFHLWNVKRIRPEVFVPYDFSQEKMTTLLYLAEGFTCHFGPLALVRAQVISYKHYWKEISQTFTMFEKSPGRRNSSLEQSSFNAWTSSYGAAPNKALSFYVHGAVAAFFLDVEIRKRTANASSLDEVMRRLYLDFYKNGKGIGEDDVLRVAEQVTNSDMHPFWQHVFQSTSELVYAEPLDYLGMRLIHERDPNKLLDGLGLIMKSNPFQIVRVFPESEAYQCGLDVGDELIAVNHIRTTADTINKQLRYFRTDETITLTVFRNDRLKDISLPISDKYNFSYHIEPIEDPSEEQKQARQAYFHPYYQPKTS
jgi:predicted metalloprotease with PDZ domain